MDYVFILDVSGSMNDDGKLDLSRNSLDEFIKSLGAADRFEVMTFNNTAHPFFSALAPADEEHKLKAAAFLASQQARGGTILNPALSTAYKYVDPSRMLNVVILSDGLTDPEDTQTLLNLIQSRPTGSRVFSIGVGNDVNKPLLENIAQQSGGLAAFLSHGDDFARQAEAFHRKLVRPVVSDLKIAFGNAQVYDIEPKQLPSLYYGAPVRLYGRYKEGGSAKVTLTGQIGQTPLCTTVAMDLPKQDAANPEIERMWAWHKVNRLLKEADAVGSRSSVMDEVVRLGEAYSIATEGTSFIVLENDTEYQRWHIERRNALRLGRDRASQQALSDQLEKLRNQATNALGPSAVAPKQLVQLPAAQPQVTGTPGVDAPIGNPPMSNFPAHSIDVDMSANSSHLGGGGAIDPLTGGIALALAGLALAGARRRKHAA
jgi:Ca-activated chloride channel family protein